MSKILFYLILKPISYLPYWLLYGFSDFLSFVFYNLIPYRKKVVLSNLRNSFPNKTEREIKTICRAFYRHLTDLIVESIKLFSITQKQLDKRFVVNLPGALPSYFQKGQDVIIVGGHYNNWEMLASGLHQQVPHDVVALYSKLNNAFFDRKIKESRSAFGLRMVTTKDSFAYFTEEHTTPRMTVFGADQSPTYSKSVLWTNFLNQDTAVALGTERFAKKYNLPVLYGSIHKAKRGHYTLDIDVLFDEPNQTDEGEITKAHTQKLEEQILAHPEFWLWTHKRWKRVRKENE